MLVLAALLAAPTLVYGQNARGARAALLLDTLSLRRDTRVLAADSLRGRETGSPGAAGAARYIAGRLRGIGLQPVSGQYFYPVPLRAAHIGSDTRLTLRSARDTLVFRVNRDFVVGPGSGAAFRDFQGSALFAGTTQNAALATRDADLAGRVLVLAGPIGEDADSLIRAWQRAGVAGILLLVPDSAYLAGFAESLGPIRYFVAGDVDEPQWQSPIPTWTAGPAVARAILNGANLPPGALSGGPFVAQPLPRSVEGHADFAITDADGSDVVGVIPGADASLRGRFILYTAHYDHLGVGTPVDGDSIYNGFSDNAAGVAMLLAIAEQLHHAPPARSVAFLFLTGEERGLLGASWFAAHPAWPLDSIAAVINLDGGAPPRPPVSWRIAGAEGSRFAPVADSIARAHSWTLTLGPGRPNSDYWPFLARGVPSLFIIPGAEWENTSRQEHDSLFARWDHYHQPSDEWHADFPFSGIARYATFALDLGRALGNSHSSPQ